MRDKDFVVDLRNQKEPASIPRMTLEEWQAEALRRGGGDFIDCGFVCPLCGNVASPRDFIEAGGNPNAAPHNCIGRVVGAKGGFYLPNGKRNRNSTAQPCDWTAGGLFGTLDSGVVVVMPDGREVPAFSFADPETSV